MTKTLRAGTIKRIHVNQQVIARCRRDGTDAPTLTVQATGGPFPARRVRIMGPSELVQRLGKPLPSGARVWIETRAAVEVSR